MVSTMTDGDVIEKSASRDLRPFQLIDAATKIVAPTTLLTALVFYFGWVYTNQRSLYFGIDPSTLGLSTQDYLLRSVNAIFHPIALLLLLVLPAVWTYSTTMEWTSSGLHARLLQWVRGVSVCCGTVLLVISLLGTVEDQPTGRFAIVTPISLGLGLALLMFAFSLSRQGTRSPRVRSVYLGVVWVLLLLTLFWAMGEWAESAAVGSARNLARNIGGRPGVVVYSNDDLQIAIPGVRVTEVAVVGSPYRFRYEGLRLLLRSGNRYFLVPADWSPATGVALVLPESAALRLEFTAF